MVSCGFVFWSVSNRPAASFSCVWLGFPRVFFFFPAGICRREQAATIQFWRLSADLNQLVGISGLRSSLQLLCNDPKKNNGSSI